MRGKVLVAEDDPKTAELVRLYLERDDYSVLVAHDGRKALEIARGKAPDLIVLDLMLPRVDGLDVCRILRAESDVPIVMLTARSTEDDILLGLDLGADDYLSKPFSPRELVARVRAVLRRRGETEPGSTTIRHGDLEVDVVRHEVHMAGRPVSCTPKEFRILEVLAAEPGTVFSRRQLLEAAFGFEYEGLERTVDVHMMNLRRKLEPDAAEPAYLQTVYGVGYRMAEDPVPDPG